LAKIAALKLSTLDEDGLLDLIRASATTSRTNSSLTNAPFTDEQIVKATFVAQPKPVKLPQIVQVENAKYEMWTTKYAPQGEDELIGNHSHYEKLVQWLQSWYV
jgi:2-keto-3-deoxy-L-rhamnonate aldolase RhmA